MTSVGAGSTHTCASDRLHTLWCWGDNALGQAARPVTETSIDAPQAVSSGEWVEVASGGTTGGHSCAIHFAGSLWCWGDNSSGQLGVTGAVLEPAPTLIDDKHWKHVSAGDAFSCAIEQGSTLWCWGSGDSGQLGFTGSAAIPTMVGVDADWDTLDAGGSHACAIKSDHSLWCWGDDSKGQLGRDGVADRPGLVGTGYASVSAGVLHTCAIRDDGSLWCWGDDNGGQLGLGAQSSVAVPEQVGADQDFSVVAAGRAHTCALKKNGTMSCWGDDTHGQLGDGNMQPGPIPVTPVNGRSDWKILSAGADHTCAVTLAGLLFCWGAGEHHQTGLGVNDDVPVPTALNFSVN